VECSSLFSFVLSGRDGCLPMGSIDLYVQKLFPEKIYVNAYLSSCFFTFSKAWIESESEVEDYLSILKKAILKKNNYGKRIQV